MVLGQEVEGAMEEGVVAMEGEDTDRSIEIDRMFTVASYYINEVIVSGGMVHRYVQIIVLQLRTCPVASVGRCV